MYMYIELILLVLCTNAHTSAGSKTRQDVLAQLLKDYDPNVYPNDRDGSQTEVTVQLTIADIEQVIDHTMELGMIMYLRMGWYDPRLQFLNETNITFTNIELTGDKTNIVWMPDLYFYDERKASSHGIMGPTKLVYIYQDGNVTFSERGDDEFLIFECNSNNGPNGLDIFRIERNSFKNYSMFVCNCFSSSSMDSRFSTLPSIPHFTVIDIWILWHMSWIFLAIFYHTIFHLLTTIHEKLHQPKFWDLHANIKDIMIRFTKENKWKGEWFYILNFLDSAGQNTAPDMLAFIFFFLLYCIFVCAILIGKFEYSGHVAWILLLVTTFSVFIVDRKNRSMKPLKLWHCKPEKEINEQTPLIDVQVSAVKNPIDDSNEQKNNKTDDKQELLEEDKYI